MLQSQNPTGAASTQSVKSTSDAINLTCSSTSSTIIACLGHKFRNLRLEKDVLLVLVNEVEFSHVTVLIKPRRTSRTPSWSPGMPTP
jgi:hypothetical protein